LVFVDIDCNDGIKHIKANLVAINLK